MALQAPSAPPRDPAAVAALLAEAGPRFGPRLQTGAALREQHAHTTTWLPAQPPDAVFYPASTADVQAMLRLCTAHRVPVIPFGAGTSLEGHVNAPAGGISLDFRDMAAVLEVNPEDMDCTVQPGITRKQLNTWLRDTGLFFPVDPGADASIGGMAATRASGTNAVRYGTMRDAVLATTAVLASGEAMTTARRARKTAAGYDLTRLLVGSEGTLAVITELTLRLHPIPEAVSAATCSFADVAGACAAVIETIQTGIPVARIELLDALTVRAVNAHSGLDLPLSPLLLLEFHGSPAGVAEQAERFGGIAAEHGATGFLWTDRAEERTRLWQARHDAYWACCALRPGTRGLSTDVCVPVAHLAGCVSAAVAEADRQGLVAPVVGHVGDGNFHMIVLTDMAAPEEVARSEAFVEWLAELALAHDGSCTGEHGIGQGKAGFLARELGPEAVGAMRAIKRALDPLNLMNPGKLFEMGNAGPL